MANIGFNPMPNISLGDMEDIFDIENELAIISDESESECITTQHKVDKDRIIKQFMLNEGNITIKTDKKDEIQYEEAELNEYIEEEPEEDSDDADDIDFDIDESDLELEIDESEGNTPPQINNKTEDNTSNINKIVTKDESDEEAKLLARIRAAEEAKRAEIERADRLRKLAEAAEQAEREAEIARKKREAEQAKLEEEKKIQAIKEDEQRQLRDRQIKLEQAKQEALRIEKEKQLEKERKEKEKLIELENKKQAAMKSKQASIDTLKNQVKSTDIQQTSDYSKYTSLDIDALYEEVRKFLKLHNVEKKIIDIKILENEFGKANVKKLILKSYLISIGKGVTVGR